MVIPNDWQTRTLGEVATYVNGKAFKPSDWSKAGRPIVRIQNLTDPSKPMNRFDGEVQERYVINDGDLLISWSATLGAFIWDRGEALLNQHIFKVEPAVEVIDKEFLYYLVLHLLAEMSEQTHGSTMKHITKKKFEAMEVAIPELAEQRRLAETIQSMLDRVSEAEDLRKKSLREASDLEGAVFADFALDYLDGGRAKTVPLGEVLTRVQYGSSSKANTNGQGVPMLRMGNLQGGHLDVSNLKHIRLPEKELAKYRLNEGDILFNRTNSLELVGKAATFTGLEGDWVFASYLVRLEVDREKAIPEYVTAVINSRIGREFVYRTARRAIGMVNINAKQIQQLELPLPPVEDQQYLVERMKEAKRAGEEIRQSLDMKPIEMLPGSILQRAFAGEL